MTSSFGFDNEEIKNITQDYFQKYIENNFLKITKLYILFENNYSLHTSFIP